MGSIRKNKSRRKTLKGKNLIKRTTRKKSNRRKRSTKKIKRTRKKQITRKRKKSVKKNKSNQKGGAIEVVLPDMFFNAILKKELDGDELDLVFPLTLGEFKKAGRSLGWGGSWNKKHCRATFSELKENVDMHGGSYYYNMLMADPAAWTVVGGEVGIRGENYTFKSETSGGKWGKATLKPICRFSRTALIINERLIQQLVIDKYNLPGLVDFIQTEGLSETVRERAEIDLQKISERVALFEENEGNYEFSDNVSVSLPDIEDGRKAMIQCTGTLPKPAMAFNREEMVVGSAEMASPLVGFDEQEIKPGKSGLYFKVFDDEDVEDRLYILETHDRDLQPEDLEDIKQCALYSPGPDEPVIPAEDESIKLKQRFLRKLNILEYCQNIEIMTKEEAEKKRQGRAGGGTEIGVTRPSSPRRESLVEGGVSGGAAGPPRVAVTRPVSPDTTDVTVDTTTQLGVTRPSSPTLAASGAPEGAPKEGLYTMADTALNVSERYIVIEYKGTNELLIGNYTSGTMVDIGDINIYYKIDKPTMRGAEKNEFYFVPPEELYDVENDTETERAKFVEESIVKAKGEQNLVRANFMYMNKI